MIEHKPAESSPYKRARKLFVKGHKTIEAGTFEITWLNKIDQIYSCPPTELLRNSETFGFEQIDDEKTKKHKKVSKST